MRIATFDSGLRFDDPNLYWGNPSYLLEPGDPGYVDPNPPAPTQPTPHKSMSNNEIPENLKVLMAMAEDAADGCADIEVAIGLKAVKEADLRAVLTLLKGTLSPAPAVPGLITLYDQSKEDTSAAKAALKSKDAEANRFLTDARDVLKKILGTAWSPEWVLAGFTEPGSTAVPNTQDERFASLAALAQYLTMHPTYEVAGGGPHPEVTAARATLLHTQVGAARTLVNSRETAQEQAKDARNGAADNLRALMIALVDEVTLRIGPDDARWETLGLNIPSNPRAPEPASALTLEPAGPGRVLAEWERGRRSNNNRLLIQVVGVDADFREYGKSGNVTEFTIKDLPTGATVRVKILALNGSLEALDGPVAELLVG